MARSLRLSVSSRQRDVATGSDIGEQIRELRASPKRFEQRITFEERRTRKARLDCGTKPSIGLIGLTRTSRQALQRLQQSLTNA